MKRYKQEVKEKSDGAANVDIELPPVPDGYELHLEHIAVENETSAFTHLRIGYKDEYGKYHWWLEEKNPQAGTLYWHSRLKIIREDDALVIRFNGTSINDVLAAYLDGHREKVGGS